MNHKVSQTITSLLIIGAVFYAGFTVGARGNIRAEIPFNVTNINTEKPEVVDFALFWRAWNLLNEKFVAGGSTTTDKEKIWGAIQGLTGSFKDPYTVFFPPESMKIFETEISGNFEGVGMEIGIKDNILTVVAPLKGTPAERSGVKAGDKILKIGDTATSGMRVDEAVRLIRGKRGTEVVILMAREGKREPFEIRIIRDIINIPTVDTEIKHSSVKSEKNGDVVVEAPKDVFVIKLHSFSEPSSRLFRSALREFIESGADKLTIDLRGNPGGYLDSAVDIASWFLPAGKTVATEDFGKANDKRVYRSFGYDIIGGLLPSLHPVVLVDGGSASASEILAGALREHNVATVIGAKTFGKGSVQELVKLSGDTGIKITVARWLTPLGNSISDVGIKPDILVSVKPEDIEKGKDPIMERAVKFLREGK